jgi:glycosyltransferase involved in cell wall biosynthesis
VTRIGVVTGSYPRFAGDFAGSFVAEHVAWMRGAGLEVEVIAAGPGPGDDDDAVRVPGRGLFYDGGAPEALDRGGAAWLRAARFTADLAREVRRRAHAWDAIVAHWLVPGALCAMTAAPDLPLLAIAHSGDVHTLARLRALRAFGRLVARRRARLSFVTRDLRDRFLAAGNADLAAACQVCPMGIDVARFRAAPPGRTAPPTVLFLGRLVPIKGVATLIDAAAAWRSGAHLVIAGAGPDDVALRRRAVAAAARVSFTGEVRGAARDALLSTADVVALPSVRLATGRAEGLPLVALEAMAARAALVVSDSGGLAELPAAAVTRVPSGDARALAGAIDALLADPTRRADQIAAADALVAAHDWARIGPRLNPVPQVHSGVRGAA